jgi:RNA polymerase sigma-54 factor
MAMLPGLQLNVSQQLKLTPQLQQSIKVLQFSAIELQQAIEDALDSNVMLEVEEDFSADLVPLAESPAQDDTTDWDELSFPSLNMESTGQDAVTSTDIAETLDCQWDDVFDSDSLSAADNTDFSVTSHREDDEYESAENYTAAHESLYDHLRWQLETYTFDDESEQQIAYYLIDAVNAQGYLEKPLEEIAQDIEQHEDWLPSNSLMNEVLNIIQQNFEPSGVAARSVQECLIIQLQGMIPRPQYLNIAMEMLKDRFDWFSHGEFVRLKRIYSLDDEQWQAVMNIIQSCNPKPGMAFANAESEIIIPDLILKRDKKGWKVELNAFAYPRVRVNTEYIDLLKQVEKKQRNDPNMDAMRDNLAEARGLIKSIQSRGETLLKVAAYIIKEQSQFFELGDIAMRPMVLRDVAESLGLHESTISRATTQKYIQTPRGTLELKHFFSSSVSQYGPQDASATAIKARIKQLIDAENPKKPISDQDLVDQLDAAKVSVARRTVAKYREAMGIPSSSQRRKR